MADEENVNAGEEVAIDETVPEMWKLAKPAPAQEDDTAAASSAAAQVGKLVKFLNDIEDQEEFETKIAERDPATGQSLLLWATLNQKFVLVEWLIKKGKRSAFAFNNNKKELTVADKWTEIRKEIEDKEREKLLNPPEETPADEGDEEEKAPEPTPDQLVADALGDIQEELGTRFQCIVKSVGELGVYQGARDEQGVKVGLGQTLFPNGDMYCGNYKDNQREGLGTYYFASEGMIYTGQWHNNLRHGVGRCITADGSRYIGQFVNDRRHGEGRYTYPDGSSYAGEWDQDVKHGKGAYTFTDGSSHVGSFVDGEFTTGEWRLSGGVRFVGSFKNGVPNGKGVFVFKSTKDAASNYQQEGEYRDGAWFPGRTSTMTDVPSVEVTVQRKRLTVTATNEVGLMTTEDLVRAMNFAPFQQWLAAMEREKYYFVESLQVTGVRYTSGTDIDEVALKVAIVDGSGKRVKDADRVVLRVPTTRLVVLLSGAGKTVALVSQAPNSALLSNEQITFPVVAATRGGQVRGDVVDIANKALRLSIDASHLMALPLQVKSDLSVSDHSQQFVAYIQQVHADTMATAQAKLDSVQPANAFAKLRVVRLEDVAKLSTDAATIVAASWAQRMQAAGRLPAQTVDAQRPPTPIPPPPQPRPDIEPLLAAERAKNAPKKEEDE